MSENISSKVMYGYVGGTLRTVALLRTPACLARDRKLLRDFRNHVVIVNVVIGNLIAATQNIIGMVAGQKHFKKINKTFIIKVPNEIYLFY